MLDNAGHITAKLIDFSEICQKNPSKLAVFYWLFLGEVSPQNFPWNRPIFLRICPENPSKFDFFPLKSCKIGRFLSKFCLFSRENPMKSADFSANLPLKIPRNFAFFFREISEALKNYMNTYNHGKTCLDKIALAVVRNITKSRPPVYFTRWKRTSQQLKIALENKAMG